MVKIKVGEKKRAQRERHTAVESTAGKTVAALTNDDLRGLVALLLADAGLLDKKGQVIEDFDNLHSAKLDENKR